MNCLFCRIINNEIPSKKIYEDDKILVFLDINPKASGHMLIIPKTHYTNIEDIDLDVLKHINDISKKIYQLLKDKLHIDGITICQNNGISQEIKHFHMHLIPNYINNNSLSLEEVYKVLTRE
ncbi:MAG: HIT domain-containing protein [Bacilli bacterium]